MNIRGVGRTILGLALVMGAAACDDNPLSEGRETGSYMMVNPVDATVNAGGVTSIIAIVMNRYGTPTNAPVSAEPCDNKVSVTVDPTRSEFESPETFRVSGLTVGTSCIIVRGGGLVDSARVRVVPNLVLAGVDTVQSGDQSSYSFTVVDANGQPVAGLDLSTVSFRVADASKGVIDEGGLFTAYAPGVAPVIVSATVFGVARADTIFVNVVPRPFDGTINPASPVEGTIITINPGTLAFDSDTQVLVNGVAWPWVFARTPSLRLIAPPVDSIVISNIGANQLAQGTALPVVSLEPADNGTGTTRVLGQIDSMWFSLGEPDTIDFARLQVPTGGATYIFSLDWLPNAPPRNVDLVIYNAAGDLMTGASYRTCATTSPTAISESCVIPLAAGTWYPAVRLVSGDTTTARLKIAAGTYVGTVAQSAGRGTQILTFTAGSEPFDADTKVRILGVADDSVTYLNTSGSTMVAAIPYGTPAGTELTYIITNQGPSNLTRAGFFTTTAATPEFDTWTGADDPGTAPTVIVGQAFVGTLGADNDYDLLKFTVTEAGTYRMTAEWDNASDVDIAFADEDWDYIGTPGWTGNPREVATATLQPGTYLIEVWQFHADAPKTTYRIRLTKD